MFYYQIRKMKKFASLLITAAVNATSDQCTGDWYYGYETHQVQYTAIALGYKKFDMILGGSSYSTAISQTCAIIEYFASNTSTTPSLVFQQCSYEMPIGSNSSGLCSTGSNSADCACMGGTYSGGLNCKFQITGVQALTLQIDDTQPEAVFGVYTTNSQLLVFFLITNLAGGVTTYTDFSIKDYEYGFCLTSALANNQLLFTTTNAKDQMTAIFDDCSSALAYNYIATFTSNPLSLKSVSYYNSVNQAVKWSAVSSSSYTTYSSQFAGMKVDGSSVKSVVVLQSNNIQNSNQISTPDCILEFIKLDTTFQTRYGHLDYTIAGAVSVNSNAGFVVVLHSPTIPSGVVFGQSNTNGAGSLVLCTNQVQQGTISSPTLLGLKVQEVVYYSKTPPNRVLILIQDSTGVFYIFLWSSFSNTVYQQMKITRTYGGTTLLSDTTLVNLFYKIDGKNSNWVAMLGQNNFGTTASLGFLIRQPVTAVNTCLTIALVTDSLNFNLVGTQYTPNTLSNSGQRDIPSYDQQTNPFTSVTIGTNAQNPCLLQITLNNLNPTSNPVCIDGVSPTFTVQTTAQTCPFGSWIPPAIQASVLSTKDASLTTVTPNFISQVLNSVLMCTAVFPTAGSYTVSVQLQWNGYLYPVIQSSFPYTVQIPTTIPDTPNAPSTSINSSNGVTIAWTAPYNGNSPITAYTVEILQSDGLFSSDTVNCNGSNAAIVTATSCTVPVSVLMAAPFNLAWGSSVQAKVQATNAVGNSASSLAGNGAVLDKVPDQLSAPATSVNSNTSVQITWNAPISNGGSAITAYKVQIRQSDGSYNTQTFNCDGSNAVIFTATSCTVPILVLLAAPFNLAWGASVYAKVQAINAAGNSIQSLAGNGAVMLTYPDAPLSPAIISVLTTATVIRLTWNSGFSNGGTAVIDYRVSWDQGTGIFAVLDPTIISSPYTTPATLTANTVYKFKVQARNAFGYSGFSNEVAYTTTTTVLDCDPLHMTVLVINPVGDQTVTPDNTHVEFTISWQDFLLTQNLGCTATVKYEVTVQSISGSVDTSWFSFDLVLRKIIFIPQASFTDSRLRITITGRINGNSNLASSVNQFTFTVLNQLQENFQPPVSTPEFKEKQTVDQIVLSWKPPAPKEQQQKELVPLTAKLLSISSNGQVRVGFSKLIIIPEFFRDLTAKLKVNNYTEIIQNIISVKVDPYTQSKNNTLYQITSLNLTDFTSSYIDLNVTFADPNSITTSVMTPDFLDLQILNTQYFVDIVDYIRVTNDTALTKVLPSQLTVKQQAKIVKIEATMSTGFTIMAGTNLALNIFLVGALKFLWGLVNILQFLVFMSRWKLDYPGNTLSVLKFIKMIALMEFMPTGWFTDILSDWFGIQKGDDQNIVENMGMMLLIGCCVLIAVLLILLVGLLMLFNYKLYRLFRNLLRKVFFNTFIRYILQSTLKLQIASLITMTLTEWNKGKMQIIIAGSVVVSLALMPFVATGILVKHFKNLSKPSMAEKIGSFYLGLKSDQKWAAIAYSPIFLIRRLLFVSITFVLADQPSLQIHFFMYMLLWYVIYIETVEPHETKFQTSQETVNEIFLLSICYHFVLFTGIVPNFETKELIGWSCIGFICMMIAFNALVLLTLGMHALMRKYKLWKLKRQQANAIKLMHQVKSIALHHPKPNKIATKSMKVSSKLRPNFSSQIEFTASQPQHPVSSNMTRTVTSEEIKQSQLDFDPPKLKQLVDVKAKKLSYLQQSELRTYPKPNQDLQKPLYLQSSVKPQHFSRLKESQKPAYYPKDKYLPEYYNMKAREVAKKILTEKRLGIPSSVLNRPQERTQEDNFKRIQYNLDKSNLNNALEILRKNQMNGAIASLKLKHNLK